MDRQILKVKLKEILYDEFGVSEEILLNGNDKQFLLGPVFKMDAIDLAYYLLEIEKNFNIKFSRDDIIEKGFSTIENIVERVEKIRIIFCLLIV